MRSPASLLVLAALAALPACNAASGGEKPPPGLFDGKDGPALKRFGSEDEFRLYVRKIAARTQRTTYSDNMATMDVSESAPPALDMASQASEPPGNPTITNNQTVGVDEGGIVKQIGRFLVVLQDGRLFSVDTGAGAGAPLRLADRIDVYRSPASAADWYDEMLVLGDRILVTAYNYRESASEITVLSLAADGSMKREGRFLLSSNDYYSTENYATRLVGDRLVFYAPLAVATLGSGTGPDGPLNLPRLRRADGDGPAGEGEAMIGAAEIYAPPGHVEWPTLHTVAVCPLKDKLDCTTTAFVGPAMREFYVSPEDAFLWMGKDDGHPWSIDYGNVRRLGCADDERWADPAQEAASLYRIPLNGGRIGAVALDGVPADQFAFDSRDGRFRALLARGGSGCRRYDAPADLALLDIPLSAFGDRMRHVAAGAYRTLPPIAGGQLENRFVGEWLVYGGRSEYSSAPEAGDGARQSSLFAVPLGRPDPARRIALPHNAVRIERAGSDAVVTGYGDGDGLSLSYVSLAGGARLASTALLADRFESENRSHAFNAWIRPDGSGLIGIPTSGPARSGRGWSDSESSVLSFIAVGRDKNLADAGALRPGARREGSGYTCDVSCVDWYGNSRPIFTGGRIFALMGTDLVEGRMAAGRIGELGRLDLTAPHARRRG